MLSPLNLIIFSCVQELAECDLFDYVELNKIPSSVDHKKMKTIISEVLQGLLYLHNMGIIHRDIKPENIFVTKDGRVTIGDFGMAINTRLERPVTRAGTAEYMVGYHSKKCMKI
jgi:serine/threonine protein kinase